MLDSTLSQLQMVNTDGTYFHKDHAPNATTVVVDSEDDEMVVVDAPVEGTSSSAHTEACPSLEDMVFNMNQRM
ncbi:unnamed protein product [Sphenostylis stenocarpa]|uniref:Uncharacterized protein n=1 Tax=Sphenostylis stenocarpa TaxID=92480 RepID=A0AA86VZU8_9FABA|nr:unnamed protein product [Sphenostylis stenocarpa]